MECFNRCFLDRWIPEDADASLMQQQSEAQIQIVGNRFLVESAAGLQQIPAQKLTISPQFRHPTTGKTSLLNLGIEGHFHGLHPGQPVVLGIVDGLAHLYSRPPPAAGKGDEPLELIFRELGIGIKNQQPLPLRLSQGCIEGTGFPSTGIAGPADHSQGLEAILQHSQSVGRAVFAAVIHNAQAEAISGVAQRTQSFYESGDDRLLIPGSHHHINRRPTGRCRIWQIRTIGNGLRTISRRGPAKHCSEAVATKHDRERECWEETSTRIQPMGCRSDPAASNKKDSRLAASVIPFACGHAPFPDLNCLEL